MTLVCWTCHCGLYIFTTEPMLALLRHCKLVFIGNGLCLLPECCLHKRIRICQDMANTHLVKKTPVGRNKKKLTMHNMATAPSIQHVYLRSQSKPSSSCARAWCAFLIATATITFLSSIERYGLCLPAEVQISLSMLQLPWRQKCIQLHADFLLCIWQ